MSVCVAGEAESVELVPVPAAAVEVAWLVASGPDVAGVVSLEAVSVGAVVVAVGVEVVVDESVAAASVVV